METRWPTRVAVDVTRTLRFGLNKSPQAVDRVLSYVVRNAYRNIAGYRRFLDCSGVHPEEITGLRDISRLPIADKPMLFRELSMRETLHRNAKIDRCVRVGTSGAMGLPLTVFMSPAEAFFRRVLLFRAWREEVSLRFPLTVVDIGSWVEGESTTEVHHKCGVRIVRIPVCLPVDQQVRVLLQYRPQILTGYPTVLNVLAESVPKAADLRSLRLVASRGEILHLGTRELLGATFPCCIADFYNAEEVGNIAWECPVDPGVLHINTDACILEIVDSEGRSLGAGEEGRVIATNLFNCTMPFIRYDLHDRGAFLDAGPGPCPCGSQHPRLAILAGRDDDYGYLPDGGRVSPRLLATAVSRAFSSSSSLGSFDRHFRRFQVIQDALNHVTVLIIPEMGSQIDFAAVIAPSFRRLHPAFRCSIEIVDDLPLEASGKFKKVICNIPELP
jgi:phenylacetate-coenzyme A ligase PaaK-like adenylate-forming protein